MENNEKQAFIKFKDGRPPKKSMKRSSRNFHPPVRTPGAELFRIP